MGYILKTSIVYTTEQNCISGFDDKAFWLRWTYCELWLGRYVTELL